MTHDSAVRTVVSLVPEIEKRGAAAVLTEYATREDLPAAQLEKLAQVYNTLRTVSHIDHAQPDERGATVPLLDVPELVVGYATGLGQEKVAAGPHSFSSHDPRTVDLNLALKRDMGLRKAAAQATGTPDTAGQIFKQAVSHEQAESALLEVEIELQDEMSKLASELFSAAPRVGDEHFRRDISEFEEEALQYQPVSIVKAAGDFMEKFAAPHRTKLVRYDYSRPVQAYAYDIGHQNGQKMADLAKAVSTLDIIKMAAKTMLEVSRAGVSPDERTHVEPSATPTTIGGTEATLSPDMLAAMFGGTPTAPVVAKDVEDPDVESPEPNTSDEISQDERLKKAPVAETSAKPETGGRAPANDVTVDKDSTRDKKTVDDVKKPDAASITRDEILAMFAAPLSAGRDAIQGAARKADETLGAIVGKERANKAQMSSDLSVEDIRRAMSVRRLIGTDPVLREADPKEVLEVYNSVVARNPQLAGDMAALRLVLREAVSYEGLTLDSQKLLTEIRRNSEEADKTFSENERRRYAVGGATPLPIAKV